MSVYWMFLLGRGASTAANAGFGCKVLCALDLRISLGAMDLHGGSRQWSCASLQLGAGRLAGQPQPNVLATPVKVTFDCALLTA